ncbi:MAG TPA: glycosyltransferase [Allosphingosinicella sp.]|nr:glycosyltransferase [Allosphingosinicella sp.]
MSAPIRIAFLLPHLRPGGAERVVLNYLRALDRSRFAPYLFLARAEGAFLQLLPADVPVVPLGGRARGLPPRLARALRGHRIHILYSATDAMNLAAAASRWFGAGSTKRILSVHTDPAAQMAEARRPWLRRFLVRRLYRSADLVAVPTDAIGAQVQTLVGRTLPLSTLPNPVVEHIRASAPPSPSGPFRIAAAGRLAEAKGHDLLIDAAAILAAEGRDIAVDIYGEGVLRAALARRIEAGGLLGRVHLRGHQPDLARAFAGAHLCALPSRREGFGNVAVEAMAAGLPVLAAACSGPASFIDHRRNGFLVPPGDAAALAAAIAAAMDDPAALSGVIDPARETARAFEVAAATRQFETAAAALLR